MAVKEEVDLCYFVITLLRVILCPEKLQCPYKALFVIVRVLVIQQTLPNLLTSSSVWSIIYAIISDL